MAPVNPVNSSTTRADTRGSIISLPSLIREERAIMNTLRRAPLLASAGLGFVLPPLGGCQTWVGGMTLPWGHSLHPPPQYIPPSPAFPLQRELAAQEAAASAG